MTAFLGILSISFSVFAAQICDSTNTYDNSTYIMLSSDSKTANVFKKINSGFKFWMSMSCESATQLFNTPGFQYESVCTHIDNSKHHIAYFFKDLNSGQSRASFHDYSNARRVVDILICK